MNGEVVMGLYGVLTSNEADVLMKLRSSRIDGCRSVQG